MAIALDPTRSVRYILASDRAVPSALQTVFLLQPMTVQQEADLKNKISVRNADGSMAIRTGDLELETLRGGLVGCENFIGFDGKPVTFTLSGGRVSDAFLNLIRKEWRAEIASAIYDLNDVSDAEKKA